MLLQIKIVKEDYLIDQASHLEEPHQPQPPQHGPHASPLPARGKGPRQVDFGESFR